MVTNFVGNGYHPETLEDWGILFVITSVLVSSIIFIPIFVLYVGNIIGLETTISNFVTFLVLIFLMTLIVCVAIE